MSAEVQTTELESISHRPRRADAQRNYDKLVAAAREAFTRKDRDASLEEIARQAGVGIGTLYRHFPTRQQLLEAVYVDEVEAMCRSAADFADLPPWEALVGWLHRLVGYVTTKQALIEELFVYNGPEAKVFSNCRAALVGAGGPLLERAQAAGLVRTDVCVSDVIHLVSGIAKLSTLEPEQIRHLLDVAIDGLRVRPE